MFKQKRLTVLSMAVLLALLVAAVLPFAAFADDGAPPPPDAPVVGEPSAEAPVADAPVTEEPSAEVPAVDESLADVPVVEVPVVDEPVADAPAEDLTVPEVLAQVPAGTDVVVLDESGQSVPLTSLAAADAILTSDPMWCPAGKKPGDGGCTLGDVSVNNLITALTGDATKTGDGTIFFTSSYGTNDVTFDRTTLMRLGALTIQGGWNGLSGTGYALSGVTTFSVPVTINWGANTVTINDIKITGVIGPMMTPLEAPATGTGLTVTTITGDVVLNRVESDNNPLYGIDIKSSGVSPVPLGALSGPPTTGGGNVSLNNVIANGNSDIGVRVNTPGNVTVTDSIFSSNGNSTGESVGLEINSDGIVTLNNVTASDNEGDGVDIYGYINNNPASVTIENSIFNGNHSTVDNWGFGLLFWNTGNATVRCSQFNNNSSSAIFGNGPGTITDDSNTFSGNGSANGAIYGGTLVQKSSGCGGGGGEIELRRKNKDIGLPQVIAVPTPLTDAELPGALPEGKTFVVGASIKLMLAGEEIEDWPAGVQVSFDIPAGMEPPFTVLSWNGTAWVEVPSAVVDGKVVFSVTGPGKFVLVSP